MISNITNTFIKAKKAFDISQFTESKNLLNEVIKHDKDFLSIIEKIKFRKEQINRNDIEISKLSNMKL